MRHKLRKNTRKYLKAGKQLKELKFMYEQLSVFDDLYN